jgi:hypothetical protein
MAECNGCQRPISFALGDNGNFIALEKITAYEIDWKTFPGEERGKAVAVKVEREIFISHFVTCPARDQFRRRQT